MTTVRFNSTDKLKELQSRIYLATKQELSQQEILELAVHYATDNFDAILEIIQQGHRKFSSKEINEILSMSTDWGEGTENSSSQIDDIVYS